MTYGNLKVQAYQQTTAESAQYTDPYTLVGMLMDNFGQRMIRARAAMDNGDYLTKGREVDKALAILHALQDTLDVERGGEVAANLEALYDYMQRQVLLGSARKEPDLFDEAARLMREVKTGWDGIGPAAGQGGGAAAGAEHPAGDGAPRPSGLSVSG